MSVSSLRPERSASANSATSACAGYFTPIQGFVNLLCLKLTGFSKVESLKPKLVTIYPSFNRDVIQIW